MAFRARWCEMKKDGWTSKKPSGLSVDFIYIKPGKTIKDVEGEDVFIGEEALMKYLDKIDLAALRAKKQARRDGSADAARRRSAAKAAKPMAAKHLNPSSPDDCPSIHSTAPVQRHLLETTPARLCAESQPHKTPPSPSSTPDLASSPPKSPLQAASPHATALSPSSNSEHSIGSSGDSPISQRNLDPDFEEAELSSDASDHSEADNQPGGQVEDDKESSRVGQPGEAGVEEEPKEDERQNDVNQIANNDDPSIFATFESDAENDDGDEDDQFVDASDDDVAQEPAPPEMQFDDELLSELGGVNGIASGVVPDAYLKELGVNGWSELTTHTPYSYLQEPYEPRSPEALRQDYPQLYTGASGPIPRALAAASTPSGAFFYFLQPQLWEDIAAESNDYFDASLDERVQGQQAKQLAREQKHPQFKAKSVEEIREEVKRVPIIEARELCIFIGLLLARSVIPNKEKLANHWKTREEGAIPRGCFGRFMTRDRFMHISRNLHFSSNRDPRAATDRAWKLRPVVEALQDRFASGYTPPAIMAFDEAMLPSRSTFNRMRVYIKDKPHKWGTKLFMLCCSTPAYCIR